MSYPIEKSTEFTSLLPDDFAQSGSNIDNEISSRLARSMWKALGATDAATRNKLNACLQDEIESLQLQGEIDDDGDENSNLAIARLLNQYLLPVA